MTVKEYVDDVLCVPVTRVGNRYITEAIELVLDTKEHKFYKTLSNILGVTPPYLETAMRVAKSKGLQYMDEQLRQQIFNKADVPTAEYVLRSAEYYRRTYE